MSQRTQVSPASPTSPTNPPVIVKIHSNYYNLSDFHTHPGGRSILYKFNFKDCTTDFDLMHSSYKSRSLMKKYMVTREEARVFGYPVVEEMQVDEGEGEECGWKPVTRVWKYFQRLVFR